MNKIRDFSLLAFYCGFIFLLSHQPSLPTPMWFEHQDKLYHAGAYFILALFAWRFLKHFISKPWLLAVVSLIFCSLYGISDEWHQSFVDGRSSDIYDWIADTVGAAIALFILYKFTTRARFR
ncbi:VanZ family protein [Methylotuvimicrobium sp. KM2]|jgi:VanZ family protein|uniref:VanZ family protein n=1 Tax=Methylotuvimicrobium sp. KM2 TaxID=3133976 RepID=UPI003100CD70